MERATECGSVMGMRVATDAGRWRADSGRYAPITSSLRLHLALLRRDGEPARATPPTGRVVVLAPHMDDEVFGCGGTIALAADAGARVTFVYVTGASKSAASDAASAGPDVAL